MSTHTYKKFEEADSGILPDKMTIYQDCLNAFNESPVNAKRCRLLISRLLQLLAQGQTFPRTEATALFFAISKLFQHPNDSLRQAVYLAIKELSAVSDDVLMATSSIMKDVQNGSDMIKPNAIRSLTRVLDESTAFSAERLFKSAVVSKHPSISSAALVSSYHLLPVAESTVKRYANETQEAVSDLKTYPYQSGTSEHYPNSTYIAQYHALGLLYLLRKHDKVALMKLVQQFSAGNLLKNQLAQVQLVKLVGSLLQKDPQLVTQFTPLLLSWLSNKYESVQLEDAKLITSLPDRFVSPEIFASAVQTLQGLLTVPRVTTRFAAVRVLNRISMVAPEKIVVCNPELESLINDSNRNVSTYAITSLLKTGTSNNIASLIKTITNFIHEISDDFKIIIIDAVRTMALKFPEEWKSILNFLINVLKQGEGGFEFKNSIVEALFDLVQFVPQSRELAFENLCDFIEDCEYNEILVRILHILGKEGPSMKIPSLYVRHIYNRVVLENSIVRSAAVVALSKFALVKNDPTLVESIEILLRRISNDADDEVRDRATISLEFIESIKSKEGASSSAAEDLLQSKYSYDLVSLESKLSQYMSAKQESFKAPFDSSSVHRYTEDERKAIDLKRKQEQLFSALPSAGKSKRAASSSQDAEKRNGSYAGPASNEVDQDLQSTKFVEELESIEELKSLGPIINTSKEVPLTETEAEFVVSGVKHLFKNHVVLQFHITNTLTDVALDNVSVGCTMEQEDSTALQETSTIPVDRIMPSETFACYVVYEKSEEVVTEGFLNTLYFTTRELDATTHEPFAGDEGFQDEYEIDSLFLTAGDYIKGSFVGNFSACFDELPHSEVAVYNIKENISLQEVVDKLVVNTSCLTLDNTQFAPTDSNSHTLKLFGKSVLNGARVALVVRMIKSSKGIALKGEIRSDDANLCNDVVDGLI
ncbi:coatomer subunit gamma [Lachancea thermotolerans CBS 6340]|uniref:Coatomer subunit gamma n=1 Tax=Lachancea thermotolerans (strain ATCC 56472 / CBS 6340 / NRRL Y-8284) TaxID=559295 RepID=C5DBD6_LACTC|nr:KLTH0A01694p [Lachancea thermotolerans CBS 6340]CAR21093.1 KLTH0A01694p [Lachancea thermotolerans CBS 6340]